MYSNLNYFSVSIQTQNFKIEEEYKKLLSSSNIGATVTFCGLVRDFRLNKNQQTQPVNAIHLECYTEMAKKIIYQIMLEAKEKFKIINARVIHRIGLLKAGEQIVFVGVVAPNRKNAFLACEYIIDFLKVKATFWKQEITNNGSLWVEQKSSDINKVQLK